MLLNIYKLLFYVFGYKLRKILFKNKHYKNFFIKVKFNFISLN